MGAAEVAVCVAAQCLRQWPRAVGRFVGAFCGGRGGGVGRRRHETAVAVYGGDHVERHGKQGMPFFFFFGGGRQIRAGEL